MLRCFLKRLALLVLACAVSEAWAADPGEQKGGASRDATQWGIYAGLGGTAWRGSTDSIAWGWAPDGSLTETFGNFTSRTVPGDKPGHLVREYSKAHVYDGYVAADGSVLWIRRGMIKSPSRWSISQGRVVAERVKLDDERRVATATALWTFEPVETGAIAFAQAPVPQATSVPRSATQEVAMTAPSGLTSIGLDWLNASIGQSFVGNDYGGSALTLDIYRDGEAIALHMGTLGGGRGRRILLRPTADPTRFEVVENWRGTSNENSYAYVAGSASAPANPLDSYYSDPRKPGDLVVGFDIQGGYLTLVFNPHAGSSGFSIYQHGGKRTLGIRRAIGDLDYVWTGWFSPATPEAARSVQAYATSEQKRRENERREDAAFEAEQQQRVASAAYESLVAANAAASANEARSRAALDATLDQAARQAAYERQQGASSWSAQDVQNANTATARQESIARDYAVQRASSSASAPIPANEGKTPVVSASLRDRADSCVGQPVTVPHKCASTTGLTGRVANSCAVHVDVRMCFMTATGWSCQSNYGLAPEQAWEPGDCKATGQIFRSVRYSDSKEPLTSP